MNDPQRTLARHALGLDVRGLTDGRRESYRNRYAATPGTVAGEHWAAMAAAGEAVLMRVAKGSGLHHYCLTRLGALAALAHGETLDREDFPSV